jgi:saccharopine dehydrogenase (NAD+, L-lysine-forming)
VKTDAPQPPLLRPEDLGTPGRRLSVVADVTCDVTSDRHLLPVYDRLTDWERPVLSVAGDPPLDVVAIDNLPSLLPVEASTAFSEQLAPLVARLDEPGSPWERALGTFHEHQEASHA